MELLFNSGGGLPDRVPGRPLACQFALKTLALTTMETKTNPLTDQEVFAELYTMAYDTKGFEEVITLVWALPDQFWVRVAKRLIATCIVGVQPHYLREVQQSE